MQQLRRSARSVRSFPWVWVVIAPAAITVGLFQGYALDLLSRVEPPPPREVVEAPPAPEPEPEPEPPPPRGSCSEHLLPASLVHDVSDADAEELAALVARWTADHDTWRPPVVYRRGVVHVESEEDRGDDGPDPRSAGAESQRACGSEATWLRSHVRQRLAASGFVCDGNVCCYGGSEYNPVGYVVFRRDADVTWSLDAWVQLDVAALADFVVEENTRYVREALRRLDGGRCPGEPAGHD